MKKTLIALLAVGFMPLAHAFTDATWTFNNTLDPVTTDTISGLTNTAKQTSGGQTTNVPDTTGMFTNSDLVVGTAIGNYQLTTTIEKALVLSDNQFVFVGGNPYWSNGAGRLMLGASAVNDFTIMAWINPDEASGENFFFSTGNGDGAGLAVSVRNTKLTLTAKGKNHYDNFTGEGVASNTITDSTWTHVAITYNHTTGTATGYINGDSIGTIGGLNAVPYAPLGGDAAAIGSQVNARFLNGYAGKLAEFGIYSGEYDQQAILQKAHLTAPVPEPTTGTLSLLALAGLCARRRKK